MSVAEIYCNEVRSNFKKYFGNWEPTEQIKLGDIGVINNGIFSHKGNISSFGINDLLTETQTGIGNKTFSSKNSVSVTFKAKGTSKAINVNAGMEISFSKGNSLYINAVDCSTERYLDKILLGEKILELYKSTQKWERKWVIITDIINSKNTTIAISETANSNVLLEAKSQLIEQIDIADAELSLSIVSNNQVGYCAESKKNITPFFCICGIKDPWFGDSKFEPIVSKRYLPKFNNGGKIGFFTTENEEFGEIE